MQDVNETLILFSFWLPMAFFVSKGDKIHSLMTAMLKRAKSQNSAGSFGFLAVGMFIEVIYFRVGLYHTLSKFNIIFSKNPITQSLCFLLY